MPRLNAKWTKNEMADKRIEFEEIYTEYYDAGEDKSPLYWAKLMRVSVTTATRWMEECRKERRNIS